MKYKIKVEVMQDGNSCYYPILKRYWWKPWEYILNYRDTSFFKPTHLSPLVSQHDAEHLIKAFRGKTIDHIYEIPYKEDEQ